jgi:hypothetical protein
MKMTLIQLLACLFTSILAGCFMQNKVPLNKEKLKVESCMNKWIYKDLLEEQTVSVLVYSAKFNHGVQSFPNLLIGVNLKHDTIAILDKDSEVMLKQGNVVKVQPELWSIEEKEIKKPALVVHQNTDINNLYCKVQTVYYGRIETP